MTCVVLMLDSKGQSNKALKQDLKGVKSKFLHILVLHMPGEISQLQCYGISPAIYLKPIHPAARNQKCFGYGSALIK